jgi:deoxyribodipyrimidine photo-lyase
LSLIQMLDIGMTLLWFRQDLRLYDNSALEAAIEVGAPILPVFIWAPDEAGSWAPGAASRWWLHHALESLNENLRSKGESFFGASPSIRPLILRQGESLAVLQELICETGTTRVFWNRRYDAPLCELDADIKRQLRDQGIEVASFNSALLNEPHSVATGAGRPYKVYTPYWKKVKDRPLPKVAEPDFKMLKFPKRFPESMALDDLKLLPQVPWDQGFYARWKVSESEGMRCLEAFLAGPVEDYEHARDKPDVEGTSSLSAYLHWGQIGPRQIMAAVANKKAIRATVGAQVFAKEVYWREFAYNVLYHFPGTPDAPLREEYAEFPWEYDRSTLRAWQQGRTGYPIVDAGMRQLWQTGWMHNRVRMIVSSFLVKHLLHDWHEGAKWFWETLVDADLASNTLGWQWSGGCGADAAPYFRIFNPIIQGQKFDPKGDYVRRYVPELKRLPDKYIHTPWEAPDGVLETIGFVLGEDYPAPIIAHKVARARALAALDQFKK